MFNQARGMSDSGRRNFVVDMAASGVGHLSEPQNALLASHRDFATFDSATTAPLPAATVTPSGGSQPHANLPPYLCVSFIISLFGIFPTPN